MVRKFHFSIDEFYHIYNRGVEKRDIFLDCKDRTRFIRLLFVCNSTEPVVYKTIQGLPLDKIKRNETLVDIGAYCLMPNHFHLLLHEKKENGISQFLAKLATAYSMYFNKKYGHRGRLFESIFQAVHLDNDPYLEYIFAYIHLNPVKLIQKDWKEKGINNIDQILVHLRSYHGSSYLDYSEEGCRQERLILAREAYPEYFLKPKSFHDFLNSWLTYNQIQG